MENEIKHEYKDPITGRYWNEFTKKWLSKKPRKSAKGQHLNKTKGFTHQTRLKSIMASNPLNYKSYGLLPINLSIKRIKDDAEIFWKSGKEFLPDVALALSTLLIIKRTSATKARRKKAIYQHGYINVHTKDLKSWVHSNQYKLYIQFFIDAGYLEVPPSYVAGKYSKMYKWQWSLLRNPTDLRKYYKVEYATPQFQTKLFSKKDAKKKQLLSTGCRQHLITNVYKVAQNIDVDGFTDWAFLNRKKFNNDDDLISNIIVKLQRFIEGDIYINPECRYGERFHSIFTNTRKEIRPFIRFNDQPAGEIDVKNSQFFFLACMTLYQNQCYKILKSDMPGDELSIVFKTLTHFYNKYSDVRNFIQNSLSNSIYNLLIEKLGKKYTKITVKNLCFRTFFSRRNECPKSKKIIRKHFPNLVRMCEIINTKSAYPLPLLLQRLESRILINMIAQEAADPEKGNKEFITVHDSYICSQADMQYFSDLITNTFIGLGLPVPILESKTYE